MSLLLKILNKVEWGGGGGIGGFFGGGKKGGRGGGGGGGGGGGLLGCFWSVNKSVTKQEVKP